MSSVCLAAAVSRIHMIRPETGHPSSRAQPTVSDTTLENGKFRKIFTAEMSSNWQFNQLIYFDYHL
jgi:hypothetical protein